MLKAFLTYYFRPTLTNWRRLRRVCMAKLPAHTTTKPRTA